MRDINRIDPFLKEVGEQWKKYPDLRFGQLIEVLRSKVYDKIGIDNLFYLEEKEFLKLLKEYMERINEK